MQGLEQVKVYLMEKISKINLNNPKANTGAKILKLHKTIEEDIDKLIGIAFQAIQLNFTSDSSSSPAGTTTLTSISTSIGLKVYNFIHREPIPWKEQVRLGDLFIEAFYNCGYVDLYYPKARNTSYIVSATNKWIELADIPEALTEITIQNSFNTPQKGAYIKGNENVYNKDVPWVRAINKLQSTGWRINKRVYEAMIDNQDLFVSDEPIEDNDAKEMKRRSKTIEWAFITHKAKQLLKLPCFYQTVEADYRGRIYYKEAFLNFQGSDLARGMLQFARGKPMTEDGLFWLAVHTASSYNESYNKDEIPEWCEANYLSYLEDEELESISVDKMTLEDRVRWVNQNMDNIQELGKTRVIRTEAEKPVSFLACCIEWYDYQQSVNSNRIHMTHLPIPVDGSNNGWQHLGAMSKDPHTGKLVGLIPVEIQHDFYVQTAKELYKQTEDEELKEILNAMPMKHIRKGISKRGSMTRAYSAGASKIAENMFFDCKTEDYHTEYNITEDHCNKFAKILIKAINTVCPGPLDTMGYLQSLAKFEIGEHKKYKSDGTPAGKEFDNLKKEVRELWMKKEKTEEDIEEIDRIVKELNSYESKLVYGNGKDRIRWKTPSDFPVEYTNFIMRDDKVFGTISGYKPSPNNYKIKHVAKVPTKAPDTRGFMCGISPNFVHSMDASHMAMVIDEWNNDFGAVHDSFSTHACDVENLLELTKKKFIDIYNVDNFYNYIQDQLLTNDTNLDIDQPNRGSLDVEDIYESDYFFA